MSTHARVSPSALERIALCPGSVAATADLPRDSDIAAAEGTLLHNIQAECLQFDFEPDDYIGRSMTVEGHTFDVDSELVSCLYEGLDWVREQPGRLFVENKVRLDPYLPGQWGYLDVGIVHEDLATVLDWKFGYLLVELLQNKQLRAYGIGFLLDILKPLGIWPKRFRFIVEQPRARGGLRFWQPWEITTEELLAFGPEMAAIMRAAEAPNAPRRAGEKQCFFCKAKEPPGGCAAHSAFSLDIFGQKFEDLDSGADLVLPDPQLITPERRSVINRHAAMVKKWFAQLDADTLADALAGRPTPGMKAVPGQKSDRKFADDELLGAPVTVTGLLVDALADKAFTKKLISPAQSERLLKPRRNHPGNAAVWDELQAFITQDDGRPILVPESDPREAVPIWEDKFDEEDSET